MKSKLGIASLLFIIASIFLKVSGLLRDMVLAFYFGDSVEAGAYIAAFTIANTVILFLNTGMKNALVPSYIRAAEQGNGKYHLSQVLKGTIVISAILSIAGASLAPIYIPLFYPDITDLAEQTAITVAIIFFMSVIVVGMNSVFEAYFDAENRFAISVVSQIIVILSSIISAILFADVIGVYSLAAGYGAGTILSLVIKQMFFLPKNSFSFRGKFDWLEIKTFYLIFIPVAITVMIGQINLTVDQIFAGAFQEEAIVYINNAKNIVHFPQAIIGVTIGTIIFPLLSKAQSQNDSDLFKKGIQRGLSAMCLVLFPAIAGMMWLMPTVIEVILLRGEFDENAAAATTTVAYFYVGSVLFFSMQTVLNKGFYALQKGHYILTIGAVSVGLNALLNFVLTRVLESYIGIPLASSLMALLYFAVSYVVFMKLIGRSADSQLMKDIIKILFAAAAMLLILYTVRDLTSTLPGIAEIAVVALLGAAVYGATVYLLKVSSFNFLLSSLRRNKGAS
ncbi:murein biosynthesis integral membrane protein MurJ [Jeotgalibacillus proteolyticus]|uniref:murein biosynthesis integral membrane protein MurJ n=1 Tax=Jeotgalibacillus proteolyticus TaxID=2082395 RepID=UPI003CF2781D